MKNQIFCLMNEIFCIKPSSLNPLIMRLLGNKIVDKQLSCQVHSFYLVKMVKTEMTAVCFSPSSPLTSATASCSSLLSPAASPLLQPSNFVCRRLRFHNQAARYWCQVCKVGGFGGNLGTWIMVLGLWHLELGYLVLVNMGT